MKFTPRPITVLTRSASRSNRSACPSARAPARGAPAACVLCLRPAPASWAAPLVPRSSAPPPAPCTCPVLNPRPTGSARSAAPLPPARPRHRPQHDFGPGRRASPRALRHRRSQSHFHEFWTRHVPPSGIRPTAPPASSTKRNATDTTGSPGKTPPCSARTAVAQKPTSATSVALSCLALLMDVSVRCAAFVGMEALVCSWARRARKFPRVPAMMRSATSPGGAFARMRR